MNMVQGGLARAIRHLKTIFVEEAEMISSAEILSHGHPSKILITLDHGKMTLAIQQLGVVMVGRRDRGHQIVLTTGMLTTASGLPTMNIHHTARTGTGEGSTQTIDRGMGGESLKTNGVLIHETGGGTMVGKEDDDQPLTNILASRPPLRPLTILDSKERSERGNLQHPGSPTTAQVTTKIKVKVKGKPRSDRITVIRARRKSIINKKRTGVLPTILI